MQVFERTYDDTPGAMQFIDKSMKEQYAGLMAGPKGAELVQRNIDRLQELYRENFFPVHGVDWRQFSNNISHFEHPGCSRCHDQRHESSEGETISNDCQLCHDFLDQAEGQTAFQQAGYHQGQVFDHPRNLGDIWTKNECVNCHSTETSQLLEKQK
jgi:hypothetical protein